MDFNSITLFGKKTFADLLKEIDYAGEAWLNWETWLVLSNKWEDFYCEELTDADLIWFEDGVEALLI